MTLQNKFDIYTQQALNGQIAIEKVIENISKIERYNNRNFEDEAEPMHFDAIILDLQMPIMDGMEACKFILDYYYKFNRKK